MSPMIPPEKVSVQCLSLPMYPYLSVEDQESIAKTLKNKI